MKMNFFWLLLMNLHFIWSRDIDEEMTIEILAGKEECFFQDILEGETLDVEYQVIDGGQGELDINFQIVGPQGNLLVFERKKPEGSHRTTMTESGDYKICWDNSFSRFSRKSVFFGLVVESDKEDDQEALWGANEDMPTSYRAEDIYTMKVEDIKGSVDRIRARLSKSRTLQDQLRAFEARDRNIAENNYSRVNTLSFVSVFVMLLTGMIQVLLLRSLFDEKSRLHRIWKKEQPRAYS